MTSNVQRLLVKCYVNHRQTGTVQRNTHRMGDVVVTVYT